MTFITTRPTDVKQYMIWIYELGSVEQAHQNHTSNLPYSLFISCDDQPRTVTFPIKSDTSYEVRFDQLVPSRVFKVLRLPPILSFKSSVEKTHSVVFHITDKRITTQLVSSILQR